MTPSSIPWRSRSASLLRGVGFAVLAVGLMFGFRSLELAVYPEAGAVQAAIARTRHVPVTFLLVNDIVGTIVVGVATSLVVLTESGGWRAWSVGRVLRRSHLLSGRADRVRLGGVGGLAGLACASAIAGGLVISGLDEAHITPGGVTEHAGGLLALLVAFLFVGLFEEWGVRGYLLRSLAEGIGFWPAALVVSLLFGVGHILSGDPLIGAANTVLVSLFFCATLRATGNLASAIGFHAAWDYTQSALFGVADSSLFISGSLAETVSLPHHALLNGGAVGPEGSIATFALVTVLTILACRWRTDLPEKEACRDPGGS